MSRRAVAAIAVAGAVLILGIVALVAVVATLSRRPTVTTYRGEVVNISSSRDAIAIKADDGHNLSGPLVVFEEQVQIGDHVTVKVIDDPNVVVGVNVQHSNN
jgi:hypothetical protein